jgi:RNA polymerase sigma factor for flagellar operon FliA
MDDEPTLDAASRSPAQIAALVEEARELVSPVARKVAREVGFRSDQEELQSVGRATLVEAARDFDAARSRWKAWAIQRLRWAMLDHLRRENFGRAARRAAALVASETVAAASPSDRPPAATDEEARTELGAALAGHAAAMAVGLVLRQASSPDALADPGLDPERAVELRLLLGRLREAIQRLPERQRALVERHWFGGERLDAIAASMGLSKSWASRLHGQAMLELGRTLRER